MANRNISTKCMLVLFLICSSTNGLMYQILPSSHYPCQEQPCLTLSQFASDANIRCLLPNTTLTLIFQPGNHILGVTLRIESVLALQLSSVQPLNTTIACVQSQFELLNIDSLYIGKLNFLGCSIRCELIGFVQVEVAMFFGQNKSSSTLELVRSTAVVNDSAFISNTLGNLRPVTLSVHVPRNDADSLAYVGGAILLTQSNVVFMRTLFKRNSAEFGGAIFCERHSNITVTDTIFERNNVTSWHNATVSCGGAIYCQHGSYLKLENVTFDSNEAIRENGHSVGGAIAAMEGIKLDISKCIFSDNEATDDGGAMYIWKGTVSISKTVYNYNYVARRGGAIYLEGSRFYISSVIKNTTKTDKQNLIDLPLLHGENVSSMLLIKQSQFINNTMFGNRIANDPDTLMVITSSQFTGNDANFEGGAIYASNCAVDIIWSNFDDNSVYEELGGAFIGYAVVVSVSESEFSNNVAEEDGGAFYIFSSIFIINKSKFRMNEGTRGGALSCWGNTTVVINMSTFDNNIGDDGGTIYTSTGALSIYSGKFAHNKARYDAGVVYTYITSVNIKWCRFIFNEAVNNGGALRLHSVLGSVIVHIRDSVFGSNKADTGGAVFVRQATLHINCSNFTENFAGVGVIYASESNVSLSGIVTMTSNVGSLFLLSSRLLVAKKDILRAFSNISPNFTTAIHWEGGAITSFQSEIYIYGVCSIFDNTAKKGGGILASESKIVCGKILLFNNTAFNSGGGAYLFHSELNCRNHGTIELVGNKAVEKGGGIHAISSQVKVDSPGSSVHFSANSAYAGGGICLEMTAKLYVLRLSCNWCHDKDCAVLFIANSAYYGGAVYVSDETNSGVCDSSYGKYSSLTECFIQTLALFIEGSCHRCSEYCFKGNYAGGSGSTLFGGLLDRCTASPFGVVHSTHKEATVLDGVAYFHAISILNNSDSSILPISSHPIRVRFCKDDRPNYESQSFHVKVEKGRLFKVPLVAVDQVNHTVNATIHISLSSNLGGLGEDQSLQETTESCTDIDMEVFSPNKNEELILFARGPCKDAQLSIGQIFVQFLPCTCPIGFQPYETTKCTCECDSKLNKFISECHESNKTLVRVGTFWITHLNTSLNADLREYEYLTHPQCPLDYCLPSTVRVYINLNEAFGSDGQCAFNRSGVLCGKCQFGFSLSLGSSHCIKCSVRWPLVCLAIIIAAVFAGILLITFLLALNLTVAMGTINGIIFYANIVNANISTFFPFAEQNYATIFINWLNLELGIDTCFFEGMDTYWKTLLQLIFPAYIIFLVVMVILISEYSTKFARLIGRKNPVATLDTLILLSYSKLLQTTIAALSFTVLVYPDGTKKVVWLPDANVGYLHGKHAFLFLIALIILLGGIAYTSLLFSWQWLMHYQYKSLFKWVRYNRLQLFIEPFHAPYTFKHRYWTGLLLLVRVVLYLASALNVTGAPAVNLLVTGVVVFTLFILMVAFHGPIYRKLPIEFLEITCYINIIVLSFATFYTLEVKSGQFIVGYISVTATISLFLVVITYHIFTEMCSKTTLWKTLMKKRVNSNCETEDRILYYQQVEDDLPQPTVSWLDAPQCEQSLEYAKENEILSKETSPLTDEILRDSDIIQQT